MLEGGCCPYGEAPGLPARGVWSNATVLFLDLGAPYIFVCENS